MFLCAQCALATVNTLNGFADLCRCLTMFFSSRKAGKTPRCKPGIEPCSSRKVLGRDVWHIIITFPFVSCKYGNNSNKIFIKKQLMLKIRLLIESRGLFIRMVTNGNEVHYHRQCGSVDVLPNIYV